MSILPYLSKAALCGSVIGLGLELTIDVPYKGSAFLLSTITSLALTALSYYGGLGMALGSFLGGIMGVNSSLTIYNIQSIKELIHNEDNKLYLMAKTVTGCVLIGGCLGYLANIIFPGIFPSINLFIII